MNLINFIQPNYDYFPGNNHIKSLKLYDKGFLNTIFIMF